MGMAKQTRDEVTELEKVVLQTEKGTTAEMYLHGAHVTSFKPADREEVIFVSKQAVFKPPKAISPFSVVALKGSSVIMELLPDAAALSDDTKAAFPHDFVLRCTVAVSDDHGGSLTQVIEATNKGAEAMRTTQALHSYYMVSDATTVSFEGLDGKGFYDNADERKRKDGSSDGPRIQGFTDRIYDGVGSTLAIADPGMKRKIVIKKSNFADAVVWNPGKEKAASMGDFGDNEYNDMVCVEPANAARYLQGSAVEIASGDTWTAHQSVHLEDLVS